MTNTTPLSQLHSSMCKFHLMDGRVFHEKDVPGGWKDFPFKKFVNGISLDDRFISSLEKGYCLNEILGFAVHWVGQIQLTSGKAKDVFREIMVVLKTKKVFVFSFNCITGEWSDYTDDLSKPERPHLLHYNLETHGMKL